MADIIKLAEQLNSDVTRLNNERSKLEGMLESAKTNYEKAVQAYEVKYGVKLTEETLQAEYNEVFAITKGAILDLQEKIESIKRGDYKKDIEDVEYDLEPDVEPIRAEVKPEPEKKKRGRKAKAEKVETPVEVAPVVEETPIEDVAEDIDDVVEDTPVIPDMGEAPFKMDLSFEGFGDNTTIEIPKEEPKKEEPVKAKSSKGRKPLTAADISAAVTAAETVKQNPVTMPTDDEDDEVDLSGMNFGTAFGEKPVKGTAPVEETSDFGFGSFGDLGGFGGVPASNPVKEEPKVAPKKEEPVGFDFGGFGGFGDFGGLNTEAEDIEDDSDIEDALPTDGFSFGGLGDLGVTPTETKKPEKNDAPITPEGWGDLGDFGGFGDFGSILDSKEFKFGE